MPTSRLTTRRLIMPRSFHDPVFAAIPLIVLTDRTARDVTALTGASQQVRTLYKHFSPFELLNIVYTLTGY